MSLLSVARRQHRQAVGDKEAIVIRNLGEGKKALIQWDEQDWTDLMSRTSLFDSSTRTTLWAVVKS
jgi:hypothetical protein